MEQEARHCPNCSAPLEVPLGETDAVCAYCESRLKFVPGAAELEVVRTREEMKYKERVAVRQVVLRQELARQEADAWRQTAARVAIAAAPVLGAALARGAFRAALSRPRFVPGCGCLLLTLIILFALALAVAV